MYTTIKPPKSLLENYIPESHFRNTSK